MKIKWTIILIKPNINKKSILNFVNKMNNQILKHGGVMATTFEILLKLKGEYKNVNTPSTSDDNIYGP